MKRKKRGGRREWYAERDAAMDWERESTMWEIEKEKGELFDD